MLIRRIFHGALLAFIGIIILLLLAPEWSALANDESKLRRVVGLREFDYLVWEADAFSVKGESALAGGHQFLTEEARKDVVLQYLELVRQAQFLERELNSIYGDPEISDPDLETRELQKELEITRQWLSELQSLAEAIVQEQVATILLEEEFSAVGQTWPPVLMRVSPLPSLLVVSPRERIEQIHQVSLKNGLSTPEKEVIESAVIDDLDRSGLVVPLGGIGTYPSMIQETSDINRLVEVVAHEWTHHWLTLHPLGFNYAFDPALRIINETVASIVDIEIGQQVIARYYPEFQPPADIDKGEEEPFVDPEPPQFDFQTELANTRVRTEELLAEGKIEEAESYMESRRLEFRAHGYHIRKLNQAFFAFYGAYAAEPGGAQGENPIGPMVRDIRENSPSIRSFLDTVGPITSFEELIEVHEQIVPSPSRG